MHSPHMEAKHEATYKEVLEASQAPGLLFPALWRYQPDVYRFYVSGPVQISVAVLIFVNFIVQVVKRTIDPTFEPDEDDWERQMNLELHPHAHTWLASRKFFNVVFLIELLVNAYGSWLRPFWREPWNWFDCVIVSLGCLDLSGVQLGQWRMLRMLRAFRVFRLFGRVESLAKVLGSLSYAMPGVINSFLVVMIVMCIYSVLAVDLFGRLYCNEEDKDFPVAKTARDVCFGRDYYGDFPAAFYTMFQILTGESWSEAGVRPIIAYYRFYHADADTVVVRLCVQLFFYSYILLNSMVLINVVIAVLLDGMSTHLQELDKLENEKQEADPDQKKPETDLAALVREVRLLTEKVESLSPSRGGRDEGPARAPDSPPGPDSPRGPPAEDDRIRNF